MSPIPASTPPAYVDQLERRVDRELKALRDQAHANHLAVTHQIGQLAELVRELVRELRGRP